MTDLSPLKTSLHAPLGPQPRAIGQLQVSAKLRAGASVLSGLYQAGSLKAVFPRSETSALHCVSVNTAGGITGGDRFTTSAQALAGARLCMTTQAAERAYRAPAADYGTVRTDLKVAGQARLDWLPQETLLFEGCALDRKLRVDLEPDAEFLLCEPLVFGRAAMGETLQTARLKDRIEIWREGLPLYCDAFALGGDVSAHLSQTASGAGALATIVFVSPSAEALLPGAREIIGTAGGASLIKADLLAMRLLAADSFVLRQTLVPLLTRLSGGPLPRAWMI